MKIILSVFALGAVLLLCSLNQIGLSDASITRCLLNPFETKVFIISCYLVLILFGQIDRDKFKKPILLYTFCVQGFILIFMLSMKIYETEVFRITLFLMGTFLLLSFLTLILYYKKKTHLEKLEEI